MPAPARLFVTGTDTGAGKTVLSLLLMRYLFEKGESPFYMKLVQTGCRDAYDADCDARFVYENVSALRGKDPAQSVPFCFRNPKAPWFAARDEGSAVDLGALSDAVARKSTVHSVIVLEGAGGLFVPVDEKTLMIDLVPMLDARPILAARAGLGTINHILLSVEALRQRGIGPAGIVLLDSGGTAAPEDMVRENIEAVEKFCGIRPAGMIGKIADFSRPPERYIELFDSLFLPSCVQGGSNGKERGK